MTLIQHFNDYLITDPGLIKLQSVVEIVVSICLLIRIKWYGLCSLKSHYCYILFLLLFIGIMGFCPIMTQNLKVILYIFFLLGLNNIIEKKLDNYHKFHQNKIE